MWPATPERTDCGKLLSSTAPDFIRTKCPCPEFVDTTFRRAWLWFRRVIVRVRCPDCDGEGSRLGWSRKLERVRVLCSLCRGFGRV